MNKRLRDEDRRAVDLLLNSGAGHARVHGAHLTGTAFAAASSATIATRVGAAEKILTLLDDMPVADPPADLVERTMALIEQGRLPRRTDRHVTPGAFLGTTVSNRRHHA